MALPQIPESSMVELNDDGLDDFEIVYLDGFWSKESN